MSSAAETKASTLADDGLAGADCDLAGGGLELVFAGGGLELAGVLATLGGGSNRGASMRSACSGSTNGPFEAYGAEGAGISVGRSQFSTCAIM